MTTKHTISIEVDEAMLTRYSDTHLAMLWHVAQANPAPIEDQVAADLAEHLGREIIRRWLGKVPPELWHHQGRHPYWHWLTKFATYEPGGASGTPEWYRGRWVPKPVDASHDGATGDNAPEGGAG